MKQTNTMKIFKLEFRLKNNFIPLGEVQLLFISMNSEYQLLLQIV